MSENSNEAPPRYDPNAARFIYAGSKWPNTGEAWSDYLDAIHDSHFWPSMEKLTLGTRVMLGTRPARQRGRSSASDPTSDPGRLSVCRLTSGEQQCTQAPTVDDAL